MISFFLLFCLVCNLSHYQNNENKWFDSLMTDANLIIICNLWLRKTSNFTAWLPRPSGPYGGLTRPRKSQKESSHQKSCQKAYKLNLVINNYFLVLAIIWEPKWRSQCIVLQISQKFKNIRKPRDAECLWCKCPHRLRNETWI